MSFKLIRFKKIIEKYQKKLKKYIKAIKHLLIL